MTIYALFDPRDYSAFYVGATTRAICRRFGSHVHDALHLQIQSPRCSRIRAIAADGKRPEAEALEVVPFEKWVEAEQFWIVLFKYLGAELTNRAIGGPGSSGTKQSPATQRRRSVAALGRDMSAVQTPAAREKAASALRHAIEVDGVRYSGIKVASSATGLAYSTLQYRLDVGLDAERLTPRKGDRRRSRKGGLPQGAAHPRSRPVIIADTAYWGIAGAARAIGVDVATVHRWLKVGRARYA
ncbi:MAG: hypothetical protein WDM91_10895 [Rhizomicrobium sp.]